MPRLVFDLYDKHPQDGGANFARLTDQHYAKGTYYEHHLSRIGTGRIVLERDQTEVDADLLGSGIYVIVRDFDLDDTDMTANVIGGFWPERTDAVVVSDPGEGALQRGGPSTFAYVARGALGAEALSPSAGPNDIIDGYWRWGNDSYGGVWRRALREVNLDLPASLPAIDLPDLNWDDDDDSNGDPWPYFAGEYRTRTGTNLLKLADELFGFGIEWDVDASTFGMYAYNPEGFGTDRSSSTFGAGKVRFVEGVNIVDRLTRRTESYLPITHLLVKTTDYPNGAWVESSSYTPGDPVRKAVYQHENLSGDPSTSAVLISRAQRVMALRNEAEQGVDFEIETGDDPTNGLYMPGPNYTPGATPTVGHFWVGDWVTLHSGAEAYDFNNAKKRVESISYELDDDNGEWHVKVSIGARISSNGTPGLSGAVGATVGLPITLCDPTIAGEEAELIFSGNWNEPVGDGNYKQDIPAYPGISQAAFEMDNGSNNIFGNRATYQGDATAVTWIPSEGVSARYFPCTAGVAITVAMDVAYRGFETYGGSGIREVYVRWYNSGGTQVGTDETLLNDTGAGYLHIEEAATPPVGAVKFQVGIRAQIDNVVITSGGSTEPQNPLAGTSTQAARCDHTHDFDADHDHDLQYSPTGHTHDYTPSTQRWEAVTNGEDVFVWEGNDLVHEWRTY